MSVKQNIYVARARVAKCLGICVSVYAKCRKHVRQSLKRFFTSGLLRDFIRLTWISNKDIKYGLFPNFFEQIDFTEHP